MGDLPRNNQNNTHLLLFVPNVNWSKLSASNKDQRERECVQKRAKDGSVEISGWWLVNNKSYIMYMHRYLHVYVQMKISAPKWNRELNQKIRAEVKCISLYTYNHMYVYVYTHTHSCIHMYLGSCCIYIRTHRKNAMYLRTFTYRIAPT